MLIWRMFVMALVILAVLLVGTYYGLKLSYTPDSVFREAVEEELRFRDATTESLADTTQSIPEND